MKSRSHGSFKKSRQSVPAVDEINIPMVDVNVSSKNLHNNIKTPSIKRLQNDIDKPQFSQAITENNPLGSRNHVATPIISPMTNQLQVISIFLLIISTYTFYSFSSIGSNTKFTN